MLSFDFMSIRWEGKQAKRSNIFYSLQVSFPGRQVHEIWTKHKENPIGLLNRSSDNVLLFFKESLISQEVIVLLSNRPRRQYPIVLLRRSYYQGDIGRLIHVCEVFFLIRTAHLWQGVAYVMKLQTLCVNIENSWRIVEIHFKGH